jgi:cell division protease FtsH
MKNNHVGRWIIILTLVALFWVPLMGSPQKRPVPLTYDGLVQKIDDGGAVRAVVSADGQTVTITGTDHERYTAHIGPQAPRIQELLDKKKVPVEYRSPAQDMGILGIFQILITLFLPLLLIFTFIGLFRAGQGGGAGQSPFTFGRSNARLVVEGTGVTFADVAGADEAKAELEEVVSALKDPSRFTNVGARIPRGVLLVGAPGTGKTLLARAVAGEAGVPFFSMAGSQFVEMFVGVGAARVRDLFRKAKEAAPCIIFIDEIDTLGRQRGNGLGNGNDEHEQTLNQLLTELDGFAGNSGVILIGATNRPDVLDAALLRPGRFDRQVVIDLPDIDGRSAILAVHAKGKPLATDVDLGHVARRTPGFSGADLANVLNEAAIFAAREGSTRVSNAHIDSAIERIIAGAEKKGRTISPEQKRLVAYHEAGHALIGLLCPGYDAVEKISIIPRGMAAGLTWFAPDEKASLGLRPRSYHLQEIRVALGGRAAEYLVFGSDGFTNGASNDLQRVAEVVHRMCTEWGMGEILGHAALRQSQGSNFLGRRIGGREMNCSPELAAKLDMEERELVDTAFTNTCELLKEHRDALDALAELLIERETVDREELLALAERFHIRSSQEG